MMHCPPILGFLSVAHFRDETKKLSEHLNIPLNKLRKKIANRHGFKGIEPYEAQLSLFEAQDVDAIPPYRIGGGKIVYLICYETLRHTSSGYVWNENKKGIMAELSSMMNFNHNNVHRDNIQLLITRVEVPWDMDHDKITDTLSNFEERIMLEHKGFRYPLTQKGFKDSVAAVNADNDDEID